MNGDAISDLVLFIACAILMLRNVSARPGIAFACAGIGCAAALGVLRFSGFAAASGPHRFLTLIASCAALPLLADSLIWPDGEPARTRRGTGLFLFTSSLIAIVLSIGLGFALWQTIVPGVAALGILYGALRSKRWLAIGGALLLVICFALLAAGVQFKPLSPAQGLHYGMAAALILICGFAPRK